MGIRAVKGIDFVRLAIIIGGSCVTRLSMHVTVNKELGSVTASLDMGLSMVPMDNQKSRSEV